MNIYNLVSIAPLAMGLVSVVSVIALRAKKSHDKGEHARTLIKDFQHSHAHHHRAH